jgi:hypothetical protein
VALWNRSLDFSNLEDVANDKAGENRRVALSLNGASKCNKCGMSVNMTCAKCGQELVHDTITTDDGREVAVSKRPDGDGMIKSPQCYGSGHGL